LILLSFQLVLFGPNSDRPFGNNLHIIVMPESKNVIQLPELGFWEKADLPFVHASAVVQALYAAITGLFRGKSSPRKYSHHVTAAAIRGMVNRISIRQKQYVLPLRWLITVCPGQKPGMS
jgi:hypothetical protein